MWQIVYIVHSQEEAEEIESYLTQEGFLIKVENRGNKDYQIKALPSEAEEVYEIINQKFNF